MNRSHFAEGFCWEATAVTVIARRSLPRFWRFLFLKRTLLFFFFSRDGGVKAREDG